MGCVIFGIVSGIVMTIVLSVWAANDCEWHNMLAAFMAVVLGLATAISIIVFCGMIWFWNASTYKTSIVNREYGTSYTREEIFYASDVIDTIRQLDRTRLEVNGDLINKEIKP